jgi:hypothetical protein
MERTKFIIAAGIVAISFFFANAQPAPLPLPKNYKTTFQNADILVMRVHYGAHEFVPMHDHTAYPTIYVYLNDSGEVELRHEGGLVLKRPATHLGAFRISPGAAERHSVTSLSDTPSDFLRVELKRIPPDDLKKVFRGEAPANLAAPGMRVEFEDAALRIERTTCPATAVCSLPPVAARSLIVAINESHVEMHGADHLLKPGDVMWLPSSPNGPRFSAGAQCLRVVLLYPPK